jgi:hypothetical protein
MKAGEGWLKNSFTVECVLHQAPIKIVLRSIDKASYLPIKVTLMTLAVFLLYSLI